ncbi:MAG: amidohydrolase family protein [Armatimonadia bacterium]|nr:amidohydrolase family protein [Armatimonadia bacterium]
METTLVTGARVLDMRHQAAHPGAVAIAHGQILAVGPASRLKAILPLGTPSIDLGGRLLVPGFVDGHVHLLGLALRIVGDRLDLTDTASLAEVLGAIDRYADSLGPEEWVRGGGWDANTWPEERRPVAADLEGHAGGRSVTLTSRCGHSMWVNDVVLRKVGVGAGTADPPGGAIGRHDSGEPDGMLYESAMDLVHEHRPEIPLGRRKEALLAAIEHGHSLGLVGCHNCEGPETLAPLLELQREDRLRFRVTHHIPEYLVDHAAELAIGTGLGGPWLRIGSLKVFADGSLGARTAAMLEPYAGTTETGILEHESKAIAELARKAEAAGLSLAVHAIGDRAVREVLDGLEAAGGAPRASLHRLEHAQHVHPADLGRMAQLGVVASVQPVHLCEDAATVEQHLPGRVDQAFPFGSMAKAGIVLCFGSDAPVESFDPLDGIRAAVLRRDRAGQWPEGWTPRERVSVFQAIKAYTRGAAVASGGALPEGEIAPGYRADLVALSHDILEDPDALGDCRVDMTMVGGEILHDAAGVGS